MFKKVMQHGLKDSVKIISQRLKRKYLSNYYIKKYGQEFSLYQNPNAEELIEIENELKESLNLKLEILKIDKSELSNFEEKFFTGEETKRYFHINSALRKEKIFEHFLAYKLTELATCPSPKDMTYLDIAGGGSPWIKILREYSFNSFVVDLYIQPVFRKLSFYKKEDATHTSFPDESVDTMSSQCAFEVFLGNADILFIKEAARILKPGGKLIILPLYLHKYYCGYSSPDYMAKDYSDPDAKRYINNNAWGIPFSRKYNAKALQERILNEVDKYNMTAKIYVIDKKNLSDNIYCHFVLEVTK